MSYFACIFLSPNKASFSFYSICFQFGFLFFKLLYITLMRECNFKEHSELTLVKNMSIQEHFSHQRLTLIQILFPAGKDSLLESCVSQGLAGPTPSHQKCGGALVCQRQSCKTEDGVKKWDILP